MNACQKPQDSSFRARVRQFLGDLGTSARPGIGKQARREARLRLPTLGAPPAQALPVNRATNVTEAWRLVFDHSSFTLLELSRLSRVCTTFDALASRNRHWAPYSPLRAFANEGSDQKGAAPSVAGALPVPTGQAGGVSSRVPSYGALEEGVLHSRYVQRQRAMRKQVIHGHDWNVSLDRLYFRECLKWPAEPDVSDVLAHAKWQKKTALQHTILAQRVQRPERFDLALALLQMPGGTHQLCDMAADLQNEPNLLRLAQGPSTTP